MMPVKRSPKFGRREKRYLCAVCDKEYNTLEVFVDHFNENHW